MHHSRNISALSGQQSDATAGSVAVAFLSRIPGTHQLVAFNPFADPDPRKRKPGDTEGLTCVLPADAQKAREWVNARNGHKNLHFMLNEVAAEFTGEKAGKRHVVKGRGFHLDVDLEGENTPKALLALRQKIDRTLPAGLEATFTIASGGGYQLIFLLAEPISRGADDEEVKLAIEAQNRGLISLFDGDASTWNLDRLLRLPGTINIPNAKKLSIGRVQAEASLFAETDARHSLDGLAAKVEPITIVQRASTEPEIAAAWAELDNGFYEHCCTEADLPLELKAKLDEALSMGSADFRKFWEEGTSKTSGRKAALASYLGWRKIPVRVEEYAQLAYCWGFTHEGPDYCDSNLTARALARAYVNTYLDKIPLREKRDEERNKDHFDQQAADAAAAAPATATAADGQTPKPIRRLSLTSFTKAAATALDHSNKPLVQGLLDQSTLSVLYGPSNAGKTFVALDIAFHIATGLSWGGMATTKGTALYVAAEGGPGARKRARALQKRYEREGQQVDIEFVLSTINLLDPKADLEPLIATMADLAAADRPVMFLVIDTFSRAFAGGEENGSTDMGTMVAHFDRIRMATAAHVCVVHHSGKQIAKGARGHSLLRAATDTEIEVVPGHIVVTKQRDLEGNYSVDFNLAQVEIGKAPDGSAVTSAVVDLIARGEGQPGVATPAEQTVLDAVAVVLGTAEPDSPNSFRAPEVRAVMEGQGHSISQDGLRKHLAQLVAKRLVRGVGRGLYALRSAGTPYSGYFQHLTDEEVAKAVSERTGVESGGSVFD